MINEDPAADVIHSEKYEHAMHTVHYPAMGLSIGLAGMAILLAFSMYQWKKINPDKIAESVKPLYNFSLNKWYIDELYHASFISGTLMLGKILFWFDANIVDGIVNGSAWFTRVMAKISGWFDTFVVDGLVNFTAFMSGFIGLTFKRIQTGKVQTYLVFVLFSIVLSLIVFRPF